MMARARGLSAWIIGLGLLIGLAALVHADAVTDAGQRRSRALDAVADGLLVVSAHRALAWNEDSFRQDPVFYALTGLENTVGALLILDGTTRQSWLFLPAADPVAERAGIDHVVAAGELPAVLARAAARAPKPVVFYPGKRGETVDIATRVVDPTSVPVPLWVRSIGDTLGSTTFRDASAAIDALLEVQTETEKRAVRAAGKASAAAFHAGLRAIHPGVGQRRVESTVVDACWAAGAHGTSFWPWAMSGPNAVFPQPFASLGRYDHLDRTIGAGELVRLDVGCEVEHLQGDVGRTLPASGRFDAGQREVWTLFVAAYRAAVATLRPGATGETVFAAWQAALAKATIKTELGRHAVAKWKDRKGVPFWELHTTGLVVALPSHGLRAGMTIDLEPIADVDGQAFYLEDMFLVTRDGVELLTPGLPTSADEIEAAMAGK